MPILVEFGQLYDPLRKSIPQNYLIEIIANFQMKPEHFSWTSHSERSFSSTLQKHRESLVPIWFNLDNSLTHLKNYFSNIVN